MKKRHAFTLVELLVVIAIIAVLLAILLPSLTSIKGAAKRLQCAQKLGGIGKAFNMYSGQYEGSLPALEFMPGVGNYNKATACIESTYLLSKNVGNGYVHLGCLYGADLIEDGKVFFCPAVEGWMGEPSQIGTNNGTYYGAVHSTTRVFADRSAGVSQPNQGWKATKGYCYWPLAKTYAKQSDLNGMDGTAATRYKLDLPLTATKINDLLMTRPIVTDNKFHSTKTSGWLIDCLFPDGHVNYQKQPQMDGVNGNGVQGTWGMYSDEENCQLPDGMYSKTKPVVVTDPTEKGFQLRLPVTPTEFSFALEP
jgi:prepilin-type N-terminal cleavage/methylation domain-containing protein